MDPFTRMVTFNELVSMLGSDSDVSDVSTVVLCRVSACKVLVGLATNPVAHYLTTLFQQSITKAKVLDCVFNF